MYRSGRFGMLVIILSTETPYTARTYRLTLRKPCKIQSYFIGNKQAHTTQVHQVDQSIFSALDNFGISVTIRSTETPYIVQTYLQTFRKPCEI